MKDVITQLHHSFSSEIKETKSLAKLEQIRVAYLGRKGKITELMSSLKDLPLEEKKQVGPLINTLKQTMQTAYEEKKEALEAAQHLQAQAKKEQFDVTAYRPGQVNGRLHPMTQIQQKVEDVFISMGYEIADGPEVETEYYNFEALNIPQNHPARDMWDTLWLDVPSLLLRTHTSPVQIHALENSQLPLAVVAPGRCYRHEATDATHDFVFNQIEGIYVDKNVSMSNLLATVKAFMAAIFEKKELKIRVRPSYFPFVEPGIEVDVECPFCNHGCSICKDTEWIETCGAGLIHPNVLELQGIDSKQYSGFAFGFGLTRLAMFTYGIHDIRLLHTNTVSFLEQF